MKPPPPPPKKIAPFRIEVREPANLAAWWIIEFAHTDAQRDAMVGRRAAEYGKEHVRSVPNGSLLDPEILLGYIGDVVLLPLTGVCEFIVANKLVDQLEADKAITIAALKSPTEVLADVQAIIAGELPRGYPPHVPVSVPSAAAAEMTGAVPDAAATRANDAPAIMVPLPFALGAILDDVYVEGRQVQVTYIHNEDGTGRAFDWQNMDAEDPEKTGTCPLASVECFKVAVADTDKPKRSKKKKD